MKLYGEYNRPISYEHSKIKKEAIEFPQKSAKDDVRKMLEQAPVYAALDNATKASYDIRFQNYFQQLEKSMSNGVSGIMQEYSALYDEIMNNSDENERDTLIGLLDSAFEYTGTFCASAMASRMTALSGVKLKVYIPELGSHAMKKADNSAFDSLLEKRKQITNDIKNTFSSLKDHFQRSGSFADINNAIDYGSTGTLSTSDLDQLSKGFAKELQNMQKKVHLMISYWKK